MKIIPFITSISITSLLIIGFSQAAVADWKGYSGANCMPATEQNNDFRRTSFGYINDNSSAAMVVCPIVRDVAAGGNNRVEEVRVTMDASSNGYCRVYSRTLQGNNFATYFKNFSAGLSNIRFKNLDASNWGSYSISCYLPGIAGLKRTTLRSYSVDEN